MITTKHFCFWWILITRMNPFFCAWTGVNECVWVCQTERNCAQAGWTLIYWVSVYQLPQIFNIQYFRRVGDFSFQTLRKHSIFKRWQFSSNALIIPCLSCFKTKSFWAELQRMRGRQIVSCWNSWLESLRRRSINKNGVIPTYPSLDPALTKRQRCGGLAGKLESLES